MSSNYAYSVKVNEALRSYGARTHGSLDRRVERLKRFTDLKNKRFAAELRLEEARMDAREAQKRRTQQRIREIYDQELLHAIDQRYGFEEHSEANVPTTYVSPASPYNLRSRTDPEYGMKLLARAIENGFVNAKRG
jgi:hypothetical protein